MAQSIRPSSATRAGLPLTVENCRIQPRHHPRCGTSFLFVVVVVSILVSSVVFSFVDWRNVWVRIGLHLLLLIPVVGVTYEFNRYVGGHDNPVTNALAKPGLWLQNFTTNEPDDSMLGGRHPRDGAGHSRAEGQGRVVNGDQVQRPLYGPAQRR